MQTLELDLGERSYPIHIGRGLLKQPALLLPHIHGNSCVTVSNETVAPLYLSQLEKNVVELKHSAVILPDGESFKQNHLVGSGWWCGGGYVRFCCRQLPAWC